MRADPASTHGPSAAATLLACARAYLKETQLRRPKYSLRAFAKKLGVSPALLSLLWTGKRPLTPEVASLLLERLPIAPATKAELMQGVREESSAKGIVRSELLACRDYVELADQQFEVISQWYHFPILTALELDHSSRTAAGVARELGLPEKHVVDALGRLQKLGLVSRRGERWTGTGASFATTVDVPSSAIRNYHKQGLKLADRALDEVDVSLREVSTSTLAIDEADLPLFKELLRKSRRTLARRFTSRPGKKRNRVYNLTVLLYPLSK
jgi:uncharacterized protein (TIGR02147 family)